MSDDYILTPADLDWGRTQTHSPVMRAASNPNPAILRALLKHGKALDLLPQNAERARKPSEDLGLSPSPWQDMDSSSLHFDSPLLAAIRAELPENVAILLQYGADPNGLDLQMFSIYSAQFLRFRKGISRITRAEALKDIHESQTSPLTPLELESRSKTRSLFWSGEKYPSISEKPTQTHKLYNPPPPITTALEAAALTGNIPIFDRLLSAKPDTSYWLSNSPSPTSPPPPSFLSPSTPLHAAISSHHPRMVSHILSLPSPHEPFNPNILPLASPTRCLPPLTSTIASCSPPNLSAYETLLTHAGTDPNILTPLFELHVLHFATATLSADLLELVAETTPLSCVKASALGHTLLHVACLPLSDTHVQVFSEKIYRSVHDVRALDAGWKRLSLTTSSSSNPDPRTQWLRNAYRGPKLPARTALELSDYFPAQTTIVEFLLESGTQDLGAKDIWGNTPLHYLASHRVVNEPLVTKLRESERKKSVGDGDDDGGELSAAGGEDMSTKTGEEVWKGARNRWGWTPEELYVDGRRADEGEREGQGGVFRPFWGG